VADGTLRGTSPFDFAQGQDDSKSNRNAGTTQRQEQPQWQEQRNGKSNRNGRNKRNGNGRNKTQRQE
jgi:hypothetical protein